MPGISFIQIGFLAAGAVAATLPIWIHLLLRQRARAVEIGSVRFLKSVIKQHTRRQRIRKWLLLALRVAALLLLGALFARPYLDRSHLLGMNREVVVLIDRSASMSASVEGGRTALDAAWQAAQQQIDKLDENTAIRVAVFDAASVAELPLDRLNEKPTPSDAATDYVVPLAWARDVLSASGRPERTVYLYTDLQKSGLGRGSFEGLPESVRVEVRDVGRALARNVAIEDARATAVEIRPKSPITITVRLHNTGALPAKGLEVSLNLQGPQGSVRATQSIDVPGGQKATLTLPLDVQTPGVYQGEVTHDHGDDLAFDNRRVLAFEAVHPDRILLVDGQQGRWVYDNETYYLETALRLNTPLADRPARSYEIERIVWEDGEGFPDLTGFRALVLANLRRVSPRDGRRLSEYVSSGGNVLIFTGDQTTAETMAVLRDAGLVTVRLAPEPLTGTFAVTHWDKTHPALEPFADPQQGDLRRLTFRKVHRLTEVSEPTRELIAAGDLPLLIEYPHGQGSVLFMATAADRNWSDWPQSRLYVPMVRQMLAYLTRQLVARQTVQWDLVEKPAERAGIEQAGSVTVVRNIDPAESLLARSTEDEFRRALALPVQDSGARREEQAAAVAPAGAERPDETWTSVIWLLLAVLACETLLASRVHA